MAEGCRMLNYLPGLMLWMQVPSNVWQIDLYLTRSEFKPREMNIFVKILE